jgi:urease accessory protein UreF
MAKGDKKAKKDKAKVKIPKRIAGVKVSKAVRQAGKSALKLAEQPAVSETVAAALLAAAAALRDPPATKRAAGAAAGAAGEAGHEALQLGGSLRRMAIDMARRTLDAWESADAKPAAAPHEAKAGPADRD